MGHGGSRGGAGRALALKTTLAGHTGTGLHQWAEQELENMLRVMNTNDGGAYCAQTQRLQRDAAFLQRARDLFDEHCRAPGTIAMVRSEPPSASDATSSSKNLFSRTGATCCRAPRSMRCWWMST